MRYLADRAARLMVQLNADPQVMYEDVGSVSGLPQCQAMIAKLRTVIAKLKDQLRMSRGGQYPNIGPTSEMPAGAFKFEGRSPIYYSNGSGHYCWYKNWNDYVRLTGNSGWRNIPGRPGDFMMTYDGICTGAQSIPAPHPDPG